MQIPTINKLQSAEQLTEEQIAYGSMQGWLDVHQIKNEKGELITFHKHRWQQAIYDDQSDNIVGMKAAQVGFSTIEILKNARDAEIYRMDIIYTLPSDADVSVFVGGKVNRIIQNNPHLAALTADKDSIEQKQIGQSMLYFRGTWTKKAAIMITADRLVHDEKDSSKQDVIADYQARLQHSKYKQTHVFSHPSTPNNGVHVEWQLSDQKEWFITCPNPDCAKSQILTWNTEDPRKMSIDMQSRQFVCKGCHTVLDWHVRADGVWRRKKGLEGAKWSGYHVSLLMNPEIEAGEIVDKYLDVMAGRQTMDWFYNKVLGLPYAGGGNSVTEEQINELITPDKNLYQGRLICGVDTGVKLRYVVGNAQGLVSYGEVTDYMPDEANKLELSQTLEYFLIKFPTLIMVIDQGGDIIGSRKLRNKYPGRVFLCHYARDRKTMKLIRWGAKEESGNVLVDRNRMIQVVVDEIREKRFRLFNGTKADWYNYWLHYSHIYRVVSEDNLGVQQYTWMRSDRDDWVHATVYWRVGLDRFGTQGAIVGEDLKPDANSYLLNPDNSVSFDPDKMFGSGAKSPDEAWWNEGSDDDWREA